MEEVDVDVIGVETAKRCFAGLSDTAGGSVASGNLTGFLVEHGVEFGHDDNIFPAAFQCLREDAFAVSGTIDVGCIKKANSQVKGPVYCPD